MLGPRQQAPAAQAEEEQVQHRVRLACMHAVPRGCARVCVCRPGRAGAALRPAADDDGHEGAPQQAGLQRGDAVPVLSTAARGAPAYRGQVVGPTGSKVVHCSSSTGWGGGPVASRRRSVLLQLWGPRNAMTKCIRLKKLFCESMRSMTALHVVRGQASWLLPACHDGHAGSSSFGRL